MAKKKQTTLGQLTKLQCFLFVCLFEFKITYARTYTTVKHTAYAHSHAQKLIIPTQKGEQFLAHIQSRVFVSL